MAKRQVRRVPVVDQSGQLVGMLSMNDIARASTGAIRLPENVEHREVAHTLSAISQPRTPADRPRA
jgi:CBS domain-containing protein